MARCQINQIDVNFHLQKSLEMFDQNSADKIGSKKDKGWKAPSLMPIRVNLGRQKLIKYETASNYPVSFLASQDIWTCLNNIQELFLSNLHEL